MRFLISLLNLRPGSIGGTETYLRQLLRALAECREPGERILALADRDLAEGLELPGIELVETPAGARRIVLERCLEAFTPFRSLTLERLVAALEPDVVFFPQQSIFPRRTPFPCVLTVVDVQHLFFPSYFSPFDRAFRRAIYPYSLRRADRIIAISEFTRRTLVERCGTAPGRISVVPLGRARLRAEAIAPYPGLPRPYLYYPAATLPHKDHATLLRSLAALRRRSGIDYALVLTGKRTGLWRHLRREVTRLGLGDRVLHLGFLPFDQVRQVYAGAAAVVFPSQFEGFGLPVVEAVELGRKVIVSRIEPFAELGVPERLRIDFGQPEELLRALDLPGPTVLEREPWTWAQTAAATLRVLREVAIGHVHAAGAGARGSSG